MYDDMKKNLMSKTTSVHELEAANASLKNELGAQKIQVVRLSQQLDMLREKKNEVLTYAHKVEQENQELVGQLGKSGGSVSKVILEPPAAAAGITQVPLHHPTNTDAPSINRLMKIEPPSHSLDGHKQQFNQARKKWDMVFSI